MSMRQETLAPRNQRGVASQKEFYREKHANRDVTFLINRKLLLHKQMEKPARAYVVYSDLHGSYEKFIHWLRNGFGYFHIAITEVLGQSYGPDIYTLYERLFLVVQRDWIQEVEASAEHRAGPMDHKRYFFTRVPLAFVSTLKELEGRHITRKRILKDVLDLLRRITRGDEHRIFKAVPAAFQENILKLYYGHEESTYEALLDGITSNEKLYHILASLLVKLTIVNTLEKHVNLGDTFDRGDGPDLLISFFRRYFDAEVNSPPLHYIWGNHDILWLGASVGNPILCVTALRVSMRYNNVEFLRRYGFDLEPLRKFAVSCYPTRPTGAYLNTEAQASSAYSQDEAAAMTKALTILEAKLTVLSCQDALKIPGDIDYRPELERAEALLRMLPKGVPNDPEVWAKVMEENPLFTDVYFPTLWDPNPASLTPEEEGLVVSIVRQFTTLPRFQDDMKWLFWKGEMYRVVDHTLYYHAALPANPDMTLAAIKGFKGKDLLDWLQRDLKKIGERWAQGEEPTIRQKMLLYYLWCGPQSPFFCKEKMATLERAVFAREPASASDLTTWKEKANAYYTFIRDGRFLNMLVKEFHAERLVMGHTPVKSAEQSMLSQDIRAFIIDGGASEAYGDKGACLINTPDYTYLLFFPQLGELADAEKSGRAPEISILPLEEKTRILLRDMEKGFFMRQELEAIDELLENRLNDLYQEYFE